MEGFNTQLRTNRASQIKTDLDAGGAAATRAIYTGPRPATGAAITTETLLGTLTFAYPCGTLANGVLTLADFVGDPAADAGGDAVWYRDRRSDGTFVKDGSITVTGGGGDMTLNQIAIVAGGPINVTSGGTCTEANA